MAFFGLTDIKFNQIEPRTFGPLAALEGSVFEPPQTLRYPLDVGSFSKGHYMIFFAKEQKNTQYSAASRGGTTFSKEEEQYIYASINKSTNFPGGNAVASGSSFSDTINNALQNIVNNFTGSTVQSSVTSSPFSSSASGSEDSVQEIIDKNEAALSFLVRTKLTSEAIALYMPDTVNFDSTANYTDVKPGESLLGQAMVAAPSLVDAVKRGDTKGLLNAAKSSGLGSLLLQKAATNVPGVDSNFALLGTFLATGGVVNPMLELVYTSPDFRSFQFEFMFYPRSEKEALEVQKIIERFRFHQAPELMGGISSQTGLLIPPSEFDIKFFYAGRQNPNIPPIANCILKSVQINYAPRGFAAYEVPGENIAGLGRTGMPVAIQMSLQFQETTYITKEDFKNLSVGTGGV